MYTHIYIYIYIIRKSRALSARVCSLARPFYSQLSLRVSHVSTFFSFSIFLAIFPPLTRFTLLQFCLFVFFLFLSYYFFCFFFLGAVGIVVFVQLGRGSPRASAFYKKRARREARGGNAVVSSAHAYTTVVRKKIRSRACGWTHGANIVGVLEPAFWVPSVPGRCSILRPDGSRGPIVSTYKIYTWQSLTRISRYRYQLVSVIN